MNETVVETFTELIEETLDKGGAKLVAEETIKLIHYVQNQTSKQVYIGTTIGVCIGALTIVGVKKFQDLRKKRKEEIEEV